jgi:hypothetical protein
MFGHDDTVFYMSAVGLLLLMNQFLLMTCKHILYDLEIHDLFYIKY